MFNVYNRVGTSSGEPEPLWHLTSEGRQAVGETIANEYEAGFAVGEGKHVYRTTELMELGNMAIVAEPIIWVEMGRRPS